jgi:uncharacterized protein (TIGR03066 family)
MRLLSVVVAASLGLPLLTVGAEDDKGGGNAEKIVGTWLVTTGGSLPVGSSLELAKDGKLKLVLKQGDQSITFLGTYKVKDQELAMMLEPPARVRSHTMQIKKLTETQLVTVDMEKREDVFKKKK